MKESLFLQFIASIWPKLNLYIKEKEAPAKRSYLHKEMLAPVYSSDQKWEGTSAKTSYVAADMVAMDSPLPVKKRGAIASSNGKLPKVGMKKILIESDINAINIMKARFTTASTDEAKNAEKQRILTKLLNDGEACSIGIDEKNEANFLTALSEGVLLVEDEDNVGTGLRVNFGYLDENTFGTITKGKVSYEDIENVKSKADTDGNTITTLMLAKSKLNEIRKERWARELVADADGKVYTDETTLNVPSVKKFKEAFEDEFDVTLKVVDRSILFEKNGLQKSKKPWNVDRLVFLCSDVVGSLVWGTLAESTNPVEGVKYATVDQYKLISKYSKTDPLQEFTNGQSLVLPVIEDVEQIYVIDCAEEKSASVDTEKEKLDTADTFTTVNGKKYKKADLIAQLKALDVKVAKNASDDTVIAAINSLSNEQEATLFANVTAQV
ncbi:hypothetical protein F0475_02190 [Prevotella sp. A2879]|uniref:Phage major capsid protein E n=1 Tax=Prevotella vespertina TaxID=2608404 RepID=A0A7C9L9S7_9BACT|nr:hypothetical protein [Prevotella vespertina]MUL27154.1 hypothetical protein [Prevotella vespertina]